MSILNLCEETKVRIKGPTEDIIESMGETVKNKICFWHVMILLFFISLDLYTSFSDFLDYNLDYFLSIVLVT